MKWRIIEISLWLLVVTQTWALPDPIEFPPRSGQHLILPYDVIDGDTIRFYWLIDAARGGRLANINAPEIREKGGIESRDHLVKILPQKPCKARIGSDKYGRSLVDVFNQDDKSISNLMVEAGHAKFWKGRGEKP